MTKIVPTDRTRIEDHEKCPRKRFWRYHHAGKGLERTGDLKLDARIGTWTHNGIEGGIKAATNCVGQSIVAESAGKGFLDECWHVADRATASEQLVHDVIEGSQIVTALAYAWLRTVAPRLMAEGEVLAIEKELTVDLPVATPDGSTIVRLMTRPDIIWRRKSDGTIFIRNLKTTRRADVKFTEKWALDQQTLSEPMAVDAWLRDEYYHCERLEARASESCCGGVIIDGLVTGEVLYDKYRGLLYHNNPLIYCWCGGDIGISGKVEFYPKYEWTCTAPHKFANGRKCEGGRTHKLSGVRKVAVADSYPGGIIAWVDYLIENHPDVVAEAVIELQPVIRSDYQIERWKRQVLPREVAISRWATQVNAAAPEQVDAALDAAFPMHTSNGNCLYPSKCFAFDLCHGTAAADPLGSGLYQIRVANHPVEGEEK